MLIATMVTHFMSGRQELNIESLDHAKWHFKQSEVKGTLRAGSNVDVYFHLLPCITDYERECPNCCFPLLSDLLD